MDFFEPTAMDKWPFLWVRYSFKGLDEQQSVQILQCYLQEDYRGTRNTLKVRSLCFCVSRQADIFFHLNALLLSRSHDGHTRLLLFQCFLVNENSPLVPIRLC